MIRKIRINDIPDVLRIEKEAFNESFGKAFVFNAIMKKNNASYYVKTRWGKIIGYLGYMGVMPECDIFGFAISKEHRGKGYGEKLLRKFFKKAKRKGYKKVFLDVRTQNDKAIKLYEKLGFVKINRRPRFYQDDDAYGYLKEL